jgi:hypothetical protein
VVDYLRRYVLNIKKFDMVDLIKKEVAENIARKNLMKQKIEL